MLTRIQIQERANRKHRRLNMMGYRQAKGTPLHRTPNGSSIYQPIPIRNPFSSMNDMIGSVILFLSMLLFRRRYQNPGKITIRKN